jgi:acyl carrier protein
VTVDSRQELVAFIIQRLQRMAKDKGIAEPSFAESSSLLDGTIDSLDLAALVVELQEATRKDPFRSGLVEFNSVGQLADLYAAWPATQ